MAIEVQTLSELSPVMVSAYAEIIAAMLKEQDPELQIRYGAVRDLVIQPSAALFAKTALEIDRLRRSQSFLAVQQDAELADPEILDAAASNFLVERRSGDSASGTIAIVLSSATNVTIPRGAVFEADGLLFYSTEAFTARSDAAQVVGPTDRPLSPRGSQFVFTISVEAADVGSAYRVAKNTEFIMRNPPAAFARAFAAFDFESGLDPETNTELLSRLMQSASCRALSGPSSMRAALAEQVDGADSSIIGYGDIEMRRDKRTPWPISAGGRIDWYIRTQDTIVKVDVLVSAALVSLDGTTATWQIELDRDVVPGFYEVNSISWSDSPDNLFSPSLDARGFDLAQISSDNFIPDIQTVGESAFTRFQTGIFQFTEQNSSATTPGETRSAVAEVSTMPKIAELQAWASGRQFRNRAGDILIKAPVPCFVSCHINIEKMPDTDSPELDPIRQAVLASVRKEAFQGVIYSSDLAAAVQNLLSFASVKDINMAGRILFPDQSIQYIGGSSELRIPYLPDRMVTNRTTCFFIEPEQISIAINGDGTHPL